MVGKARRANSEKAESEEVATLSTDVRVVSDHQLTDTARILATSSRDVFLIKDSDFKITTFVSTAIISMASIAFSPFLLTRDNFDNRSWCTRNLVANKPEGTSLGQCTSAYSDSCYKGSLPSRTQRSPGRHMPFLSTLPTRAWIPRLRNPLTWEGFSLSLICSPSQITNPLPLPFLL